MVPSASSAFYAADSASRISSFVKKFFYFSDHAQEVRKLNLQTIAVGVEVL
jgi:hypothetical protein